MKCKNVESLIYHSPVLKNYLNLKTTFRLNPNYFFKNTQS